jgi:hypothetical protein
MANNKAPSLEDIQYELRMLLGAAALCRRVADKGNITNYFKDSVYLHARILYEFFTQPPTHDASIQQFDHPLMTSTLYPLPLRDRLNRRVMHMNKSRGANAIHEPPGTIQLNEQIGDIVTDIKALFQTWIASCADTQLKADLTELVKNAERQAKDDESYAASKSA